MTVTDQPTTPERLNGRRPHWAGSPTSHAVSGPAGTARVNLLRVTHSEWIKFRSLRSSVLTLGIAAVIIVGLGVTIAAISGDSSANTGGPGGGPTSTSSTDLSLSGVGMAQLVVAVLGVLFAASEYATGMIRSSMAAVPSRLPVLWGKAIAFTAVTFTTMLAAVTVAFLAGQAMLGDEADAITDDGVISVLVGNAAYLTAIGLIGIALGVLLRNTAAGISVLVAILMVLPLVSNFLPDSWSENVTPYLPSNAGSAFSAMQPADGLLSPTGGAVLLAGYVVVLFAAAALRLRRQDV